MMVHASADLKAHHDEGEDCQTTASNPSVVHAHSSAIVANQLDTGVDVTVEPVDLHASTAAHQQPNKGGSEDTISIEVPVIAEPDTSSTNKAVTKVGDQQTERLPVITCTGKRENHFLYTTSLQIPKARACKYPRQEHTLCGTINCKLHFDTASKQKLHIIFGKTDNSPAKSAAIGTMAHC